MELNADKGRRRALIYGHSQAASVILQKQKAHGPDSESSFIIFWSSACSLNPAGDSKTPLGAVRVYRRQRSFTANAGVLGRKRPTRDDEHAADPDIARHTIALFESAPPVFPAKYDRSGDVEAGPSPWHHLELHPEAAVIPIAYDMVSEWSARLSNRLSSLALLMQIDCAGRVSIGDDRAQFLTHSVDDLQGCWISARYQHNSGSDFDKDQSGNGNLQGRRAQL